MSDQTELDTTALAVFGVIAIDALSPCSSFMTAHEAGRMPASRKGHPSEKQGTQ